MSQLMSVRRIGAAVRLMDGFTGQPAGGAGLCVKMDDGAVPVRKPEGYYIFWDNGKAKRRLEVEGEGYEQESFLLDIEALKGKDCPTCCLWLKPGSAYAYPPEIKLEKRLYEPEKEVVLPLQSTEGCIRLANAYPIQKRNPSEIHLQVSGDLEMENRCLCIRDRKGQEEFFAISSVKNRFLGLYTLKAPLKGAYGPYEAEILLTLTLRADKRGELLAPVNC